MAGRGLGACRRLGGVPVRILRIHRRAIAGPWGGIVAVGIIARAGIACAGIARAGITCAGIARAGIARVARVLVAGIAPVIDLGIWGSTDPGAYAAAIDGSARRGRN